MFEPVLDFEPDADERVVWCKQLLYWRFIFFSFLCRRGGDQDEGDIYAVLWARFLGRYLSGSRFRSIRAGGGRAQHNLSWLGRTVAIAIVISTAADAAVTAAVTAATAVAAAFDFYVAATAAAATAAVLAAATAAILTIAFRS